MLSFSIGTINEKLPLNGNLVAGRMSFSSDLNDFCENFRNMAESFTVSTKYLDLEPIATNPRYIGDRGWVISDMERKTHSKRLLLEGQARENRKNSARQPENYDTRPRLEDFTRTETKYIPKGSQFKDTKYTFNILN